MGTDDPLLVVSQDFVGDPFVGEVAKTGVEAVDELGSVDRFVDDPPARPDSLPRGAADRDRHPVRDLEELGDGQRGGVDRDRRLARDGHQAGDDASVSSSTHCRRHDGASKGVAQ